MKQRVFAGLVTAKPPREIPGKSLESSLQEISARNPTLMVPQGDSIIEQRERLLLLYDAALTPPDMPGSFGIPAWALDTARLSRAAQFAKDKLPATLPIPKTAFRTITDLLNKFNATPQQSAAAAARLSLAVGQNLGSGAGDLLKVPLESWQDVIALASTLAEDAKFEPPIPPPGGGDEGEGDEGEGDKGEGDEGEGEDYADVDAAMDGRFRGDPWSPSFIPKPSGKETRPGKLENAESPDQLPMEPRRKRGARRRPEMEGSTPSAWHRLPLDGKIFRGAPMRGGSKGRGTILVDMSSSMSWTESDFAELLNAVPECSVYGYAGFSGGKAGRIVLLADRGRIAQLTYVSKWKVGKGSNIIDAPCLQFLARMPRPRIWLSDGGVTGCGDRQTSYIVQLCAEACARGEITRVRNAETAAKLILSGHFASNAGDLDAMAQRHR